MQEGSLVRPVWGMMICLGYLVLLLECKPYKAPEDNFLAVLASFALFLVLSGGLISAMTVGFVSTGEYIVGIENDQLGVALIACFLSVMVFGLGCVAMNIFRVSSSPLVRQAGAAVVVKALGDGCYHLFLSHTWGTGQNQVRILHVCAICLFRHLYLSCPTVCNKIDASAEKRAAAVGAFDAGIFRRREFDKHWCA
jgi:hypothetical protein